MSQALPILELVPRIREALIQSTTLILQAPPGAGKSTVLPLQLLEEPWLKGKKIILLEPRRLAARSVAARMAEISGERVGETIGFRVRFDHQVGPGTRIEVVTENILTRMLHRDPALEEVGLILFDEFHERSLNADLALVLSRQVQEILREDLRLVIMSATLDTSALAELAGTAPIVTSEGRQHPVEVFYMPPERDQQVPWRIHLCVAKAVRKALREQEGDILVFLPGAGEIRRTQEALENAAVPVRIHPLFGDLSLARQQEALLPDPTGHRKVVLATSIAETSLTIEGIKTVIDSGFSRVPRFHPKSGLTRLETVTVTRDSADQRAGRAGRLGPGTVYRLWSEGAQLHLQDHRQPEILNADLAQLVLELAQWGVSDAEELDWPTPPPKGALAQATQLLEELGALEEGQITPRGKEILRMPTHPRLGHLLLESKKHELAALGADVAALLEERDPLPRDSGADLSLRVSALRDWRAGRRSAGDQNLLKRIERLAKSWRKLLKTKPDNHAVRPESIGLLVAAAYPHRVAQQLSRHGEEYRLSNSRRASLRPGDSLIRETWLAVAQMDAGQQNGRIFLAAPVDPYELQDRMELHEVVTWDEKKGILVAQSETRIGDLTVESTPLKKIPENQRIQLLCEAIRNQPSLLPWSKEIEEWQARIGSLRTWRPEEGWPDVSETGLLDNLEDWLGPYLGKVNRKEALQKLDLKGILSGLLPWPLPRELDRLAPTHLTVPTGSSIRLNYQPDGSPPILAVRLQEVFGLHETPAVNEGHTQVIMHLLSPAYRPVQVTKDLHNFWKNTYQEVRKDLRGRYSKHYWPEDPFTATPMRGTKKQNRKKL